MPKEKRTVAEKHSDKRRKKRSREVLERKRRD